MADIYIFLKIDMAPHAQRAVAGWRGAVAVLVTIFDCLFHTSSNINTETATCRPATAICAYGA